MPSGQTTTLCCDNLSHSSRAETKDDLLGAGLGRDCPRKDFWEISYKCYVDLEVRLYHLPVCVFLGSSAFLPLVVSVGSILLSSGGVGWML